MAKPSFGNRWRRFKTHQKIFDVHKLFKIFVLCLIYVWKIYKFANSKLRTSEQLITMNDEFVPHPKMHNFPLHIFP